MGISLGVHGRMRVGVSTAHRAPLVVLTALLLITPLGCGKQRAEKSAAEQKSAAAQTPSKSKVTATTASTDGAKRSTKGEATVASREESRPTGATNRIRLSEKGCVQFEPHWTNIRMGQSLSWHSDLKSPVVIHVSSGAFDKTEYVVRPGATVSTGPARNAGAFSIWTEPAACQGVPRGVQSSSPGVTVEGKGPQ